MNLLMHLFFVGVGMVVYVFVRAVKMAHNHRRVFEPTRSTSGLGSVQ